MTFFGLSMTEKIMVEARARKISGSSRLWWVVGVEGCTVICAFLSYVRVREGVGQLKPSALATLLNPSNQTLGC